MVAKGRIGMHNLIYMKDGDKSVLHRKAVKVADRLRNFINSNNTVNALLTI